MDLEQLIVRLQALIDKEREAERKQLKRAEEDAWNGRMSVANRRSASYLADDLEQVLSEFRSSR